MIYKNVLRTALLALCFGGVAFAQVSGPTTKTPRLTVGNLTVTGTMTCTGDCSAVSASVPECDFLGGDDNGDLICASGNPLTVNLGGTGLSTVAEDQIIIGDQGGDAFFTADLPNCLDTGGNHLNYESSTGTLICGTSLPTLNISLGATGITTISDDQLIVGTGADTTAAKSVPDCDDTSGNHLNYDTGTNAFTCGTSAAAGGVTESTGSFTAAIGTGGCSAAGSVGFNYSKTGKVVILRLTSNNTTCTSNSTNHTASATGDVPSTIRPAGDVTWYGVAIINNGTAETGCMSISSAGTIIWERVQSGICQNNGYTATGSRGIQGTSNQSGLNVFMYTLQ